MRKNLLFLIFIFLSYSAELLSQYDARKLPEFLDINRENFPVADSRGRSVFYKNLPPPPKTKIKVPDRILADGFEIINISGGNNNNQSETWITYNPVNPENIVAGANDYNYLSIQSGYRMSAYSTENGFQNWSHSTTPDNNGLYLEITNGYNMLVFDPGITFDSRGWCYYSYGAAVIDNQDRNYDNGLFVCRSKDGGKSWEEQVAVAYTNQGTLNQVFHDRYSIMADANPASPYKDYIYLTWKRFIQNVGICFSKSTDAGDNWSQPTLIPGGNTGQSQSPIPVVGTNGELYVVWRNPYNEFDDVMFQKSINGGNTWLSTAKKIQSVKPIGVPNSISGRDVLENKGSMRVSSLPYIAVDMSNGPRRGYIYIVQTGRDENGLTRLYLAKSTNGGNEWTTKIRIDDNQYGNDMWFPNISVDAITGMISVVYYSSQNDSENKGFDVYLAISNDGINFRNIRITPQMIKLDSPDDIIGDNGNYYWGDYTSITSYNGKIYPCWWMPSGYNSNFWTNDVFVALLSTNPKPPANFVSSSDYQSPNTVTLNWIDPKVNQLTDPLGDFVIIIYRDNIEIARVNKGMQTYVDPTAVDGQQYTYSIRTHTTEGLESILVNSTVVAGGGLKPFPPTKISSRPTSTGIILSWENPMYHTDSTYSQDVNKIDIYVDSVKNQTYSGSIQAGQISGMTLNIQPNQFHQVKLKAIGKRGSIETESDFSGTLLTYAGNVLTELSDSFDISPDPIVKYTTNGWGTTNIKSISPPNSITDSPQGDYPNNNSNFLYFQPVIISPEKNTISFEHIAIIQKNGDWGIVHISSDFGATWKGVLGVNSGRSAGFTDNVATSSWYSERIGLSDYIGDTLTIAFELYSNNFSKKDGWYIDDLRIDDSPAGIDNDKYIYSGLTLDISPNPAANKTKINLFLPFADKSSIKLYDILGNEVMNLYEGFLQSGAFELDCDLSGLDDGIYYVKANIGKTSRINPVVINK
ncbi:MAG: T9SS type A sorting domain-containing protein [Bacteroidetes bacterium]|nr:MAG: T9SS type A sorting domain-containing protein [Bacteroidota bacterium]